MELKTCPYCGEEAEVYAVEHIPSGWDYIPKRYRPIQ